MQNCLAKASYFFCDDKRRNYAVALGYAVAGLEIQPRNEDEANDRIRLVDMAQTILNGDVDLRSGKEGKPVAVLGDHSVLPIAYFQSAERRVQKFKNGLTL